MAYVLVTIVSHAVHVLTSVHQVQFLRAKSIQLIQMLAQSAALAHQFAHLRLSALLTNQRTLAI